MRKASMKFGLLGCLCTVALAVLACSSSQTAGGAMATATIEARSGSTVLGKATFTEMKDGTVSVVVELQGVPPGEHGVHLHEKGDCSAPDAKSAGSHFNPTTMQHGGPMDGMHHAGDFGNITIGSNGTGALRLSTKDLTVTAGETSVAGRSIIIHEKADDMKTQPTGDAGGRIGCGVIQQGE